MLMRVMWRCGEREKEKGGGRNSNKSVARRRACRAPRKPISPPLGPQPTPLQSLEAHGAPRERPTERGPPGERWRAKMSRNAHCGDGRRVGGSERWVAAKSRTTRSREISSSACDNITLYSPEYGDQDAVLGFRSFHAHRAHHAHAAAGGEEGQRHGFTHPGLISSLSEITVNGGLDLLARCRLAVCRLAVSAIGPSSRRVQGALSTLLHRGDKVRALFALDPAACTHGCIANSHEHTVLPHCTSLLPACPLCLHNARGVRNRNFADL